jgi:hypothetical protein
MNGHSNPRERRKHGGVRSNDEIIDDASRLKSKLSSKRPDHQIRIEERKKVILNALRAGNTRRDSHTYAGVGPNTMSLWMKVDEDFRNDVVQAEAAAKVTHVTNLARAAQAGSWQASLAWLERRCPREWGKITQLDMQFKGMDREQLRAYIADRLGELDGPGTGSPGSPALGGADLLEGEVVHTE